MEQIYYQIQYCNVYHAIVYVFALNIVIDITVIDLRRGKS